MTQLERAVYAAQVYAGSNACNVKDAQRLYNRFQSACRAVAKAKDMAVEDVMSQVGAEASRRGAITPRPGQHL